MVALCYLPFTYVKVHIFWEGHKILRNLPLTFDCMHRSQNFVAFSEYMNLNNSIYEVKIFTKLELHNRCWSRRNELVVWVGYIFSNAIHMNFDFLPPLKRHTLNLSAHSDRFVKISLGKLPVLEIKKSKINIYFSVNQKFFLALLFEHLYLHLNRSFCNLKRFCGIFGDSKTWKEFLIL